MSGLFRRYSYMPSIQVLTEIEGVTVVDLFPPSIFLGRVSGTLCLVGEWPAGPFETPTAADDAQATIAGVFGGFSLSLTNPFSWSVSTSTFTNPFSNGNAYAWLANKRFRRLVLTRVNNALALGVHVKLTSSPAVAATGSIQIPAGGGASLVDGETFTLSDGYNSQVTFEYNSGTAGAVQAGNIEVAFTGGDTQAQVATATKAAIDAQLALGTLKLVTGVIAVGLFSLTNSYAGEHGNVTATETVANAGFIVTGMSGGTGMGLLLADLVLPAGTRVLDASSTGRTFGLAQNVTFAKGTDLGTAAFTAFSTTDLAKRYATRTVSSVPVYSMKGVAEGAVGDVDSADATDLFRAGIGTGAALPYIVVTPSTGALDGAGANASALTPLTSAQYDSRYESALLATKPGNSTVDFVDVVACARESAAIRIALRTNARDSSAEGTGRIALVRPPIGTKLAGARGTSSPGVAATRSSRVVYCYPHFKMTLSELDDLDPNATISTPEILVGADSAMGTLVSNLAPEMNPGQSTNDVVEGGLLSFAIELEPGLTSSTDATAPTAFSLPDYVSMKASGIAGLRRDQQIAEWVFQSGVTSVDPSLYPSAAPINRQRFADFVNDSLAMISKKYSKKPKTKPRASSLLGEYHDFLSSLKSENDPELARCEDYSVSPRAGNTAALAGLGVTIFDIRVKMFEDMNQIVLVSTVGAGVTVESFDLAA